MGTIHDFPPGSRPVTGNGGDDGTTFRLQAVEEDVREIKQDVKGMDARLRAVEGDIREIKSDMKHVATRSWILGGVLGGMGIAAGVAVGIARLLSSGGAPGISN